MSERYRVLSFEDAKAQGLPGLGKWNDYGSALYDFGVTPPVLVATDEMQPEDANFWRDLEWVPTLLNQHAARIVERAKWIEPLKRSDDPEEAEACRVTPDYVLLTRDAADGDAKLHKQWRTERDAARAEIAHLTEERNKANAEADRYCSQWVDARKRAEQAETASSLYESIADNWKGEAESLAGQLAALTEVHERLRELVVRFRGWDMLDCAGDGPFWKREIDALLSPREGTPQEIDQQAFAEQIVSAHGNCEALFGSLANHVRAFAVGAVIRALKARAGTPQQ